MDPFTAIGLVSAIVQFVDFGITLVSQAHEIYKSADGALEENIEIEAIAHSLQNVTVKLNTPTQPQGSGSTALTQVDRDIIDLANKSKAVADELSKVMGKLQVQAKKSKMKSLGMALKSVWKKSEIVDLEGRLVKIRDELSFNVTISIREKIDLVALKQDNRFKALDKVTQDIIKALQDNSSVFTSALQAQTDILLKHQESGTIAILEAIRQLRITVPECSQGNPAQLEALSTLSTMPPDQVLTALQEMAGILDRRIASSQVSHRNLKHKQRDITQQSKLDALNFRSTALFEKHQRILIEWKPIKPDIQGYPAIVIGQRVDDIARLLRQDDKPPELRTLNCLGYVVEFKTKEARYGFLYEIPGTGIDNPWSLAQLFCSPNPAPPVQDRIQLALTLAKALLLLHLCYWLHKSIRSHNILFFAPELLKVDVSHPFFTGFDFSRSDEADPVTEIPGAAVEFNLYRHPDCQGLPVEPVQAQNQNQSQATQSPPEDRPPFSKKFDIYSFGLVLVEISLWKTLAGIKAEAVAEADYGADTPARFREWILDRVVPNVKNDLIDEYGEIVRVCLQGDLFDEEEAVVSFYLYVVKALENLM